MQKWFETVLVHPVLRQTVRLAPIQLIPTQISDAGFLIEGLRNAYGIEAVILKRLGGRRGPDKKFEYYTYALRSLSEQLPSGFRWSEGPDADDVFSQIDQVQIDQPWSHPDWWPKTKDWISSACARAGLPNVREITQIRAWDLSAVIAAKLEHGSTVFYKAVPRAFAAEPALTSWLAEATAGSRAPARGPEVIEFDHDQRCILLRACSGTRLDQAHNLRDWERALRDYAAIQKHAVPHTNHLVSIGVPRRSLSWLPEAWDRLKSDRQCLQPGAHTDLNDEEFSALNSANGPQVATWVSELEGLGIPDTLEHGDFHPLNVFTDDTGTTIIDWTDAAVTHPFLSLACFLKSLRYADAFTDKAEAAEKLSASYLSCWTAYASYENLLKALPTVARVGAVFQAVHYRERINPLVDKYEEVFSAAPAYARDVLADA